MTVLETDRLVLSTWQASDWLEFRPIATDPEVMRYITVASLGPMSRSSGSSKNKWNSIPTADTADGSC
jgi:hypothetical protein